MVQHLTPTLKSKFFTIEEFTRSDTAVKHGIKNIPSACVVENLCYGCKYILDPLRDDYGMPIIISSGYRCPQLNKLVGGVSNSWHQYGNAADIKVKNQTDAKLIFDILQKNKYVDTVLFEHSKSSIWLHVQWNKDKTPRHHFNFNYIAK